MKDWRLITQNKFRMICRRRKNWICRKTSQNFPRTILQFKQRNLTIRRMKTAHPNVSRFQNLTNSRTEVVLQTVARFQIFPRQNRPRSKPKTNKIGSQRRTRKTPSVDVVGVRSGIKFLRKLNNCWVMGPKTVNVLCE